MKNKLFLLGLMAVFCSASLFASKAEDEIDNLLGKGELISISNSYFSVFQNMYPETATRMGFERGGGQLNERNSAADQRRKTALEKVRNSMAALSYGKLTYSNKVDYDIMKNHLSYTLRDLTKKRYQTDPFYYAESIDSVYDVMLKRMPYRSVQIKDIADRTKAMPELFNNAVKNINSTTPASLNRAKLKVYNAFTNTNDILEFSKKAAGPNEIQALTTLLNEQKAAMRTFFDFLDKFENPKNKINYAMGNSEYSLHLLNRYYVTVPPSKLVKPMEKNLAKYKDELVTVLTPFKKPAAKDSKKDKTEVTPMDFAAVFAANTPGHPEYKNLMETIATEIQTTNAKSKGLLPVADMKINVNFMPEYLKAYHPATLFVPPYGAQSSLTGNLFVSVPQHVQNYKQMDEHLEKYFTYSHIRLLAIQYVVPGQQAFYSYSYETGPIRRILGTAAIPEAWGMFARDLALEAGMIKETPDKLLLAWENYLAAAKAYADLKFHRKDLSYDEVLALFLSFGIKKDDAEIYLQDIIRNPGHNLAVFLSYEKIKEMKSKYQSQMGAEFNIAHFVGNIFSIGKVPYHTLDREIETAYKKEPFGFITQIEMP